MAAAAAGQSWWAVQRRRWGARTSPSARDGINSKTLRLASLLLVVLAGAMIFCALIGFAVTARSDSGAAAQRQAALRATLDEFHAVFGDVERFDDAQLRLIERRSGLKDLRFDSDAPIGGGRELQSLQNGAGRIVGWFSWQVDRGLVRAMDRLWALVAIAGVALAAAALLAARAAKLLAGSLRRSTETVRRLTQEDALTGLPNQKAMLDRLEAVLAGRGPGHTVVLARIDLDAFGEINDSLGRSGGDAVMINIVQHLSETLPASAVLGRFEEDEFAVIMCSDGGGDGGAGGGDPQAADALADDIRAALYRPIFMERVWHVSAGIGLAQAPRDGTTAEQLARRAGMALRAAKREGRGGMRRFELEIETAHADRVFLLRELESAVAREAFDVHYQPIVAADGGAVVGVEALLRWTHPARGAIPPAVFIPLAEQIGLMSKLGELVLRRALADGLRWPQLTVAVNLSPVQIRDPTMVALVGVVMAEAGMASSRVVLEVTEGILIDDPKQAQMRLEALRALGIAVALDDFGTGYSSLNYLQRFPFDQLKIDRAFVASLGTAANTGAIIQSIVTLGHALGMTVVAEGVETDEQRVLLRLAGCDKMQGFLFAPPMPAADIDRLVLGGAAAMATTTAPRPAATAR